MDMQTSRQTAMNLWSSPLRRRAEEARACATQKMLPSRSDMLPSEGKEGRFQKGPTPGLWRSPPCRGSKRFSGCVAAAENQCKPNAPGEKLESGGRSERGSEEGATGERPLLPAGLCGCLGRLGLKEELCNGWSGAGTSSMLPSASRNSEHLPGPSGSEALGFSG